MGLVLIDGELRHSVHCRRDFPRKFWSKWMPRIRYVSPDGTSHEIDAIEGESVMQAARDNGLAGIDGECGGSMSCCTCHVIIDPEWFSRTGTPGEMETAMLELVAIPTETSRLGCQIRVSRELDGLVVNIPLTQV